MKDRFRAASNVRRSVAANGHSPMRTAPFPIHAVANEINVDVFISRPIVLEIAMKGWPNQASDHAPQNSVSGKEKAWSIPTSVGASSPSRLTSHSAIPRRVHGHKTDARFVRPIDSYDE